MKNTPPTPLKRGARSANDYQCVIESIFCINPKRSKLAEFNSPLERG